MSCDARSYRPRLLKLAFGLTAVAMLAGCQGRPLYSEASGTGPKLAEIAFSPADERVEQVVRNQLIFLTSGGAGETPAPQYEVALQVIAAYSDILDDEDAVGLQPGRVNVSGNYTLSRASDGEVLKVGTRRITSLLDVSRQEFAELRAVRDAEDRAAKELAELIRADLAIALSREPQPQPTWQK